MSKLSRKKWIRWFPVFVGVSLLAACSETGSPQENPSWQSTMPVSMNGKLPQNWANGWEQLVWHNAYPTKAGDLVRETWKPDIFFDDPLVIRLCDAIFEVEIEEMESLIAQGADVNRIGIERMTPLYWAFHMERDPRPFALLLKHGANPNIIVKNTLCQRPVYEAVLSGNAVTHLVAQCSYNRQFENVFENGGNPNLISESLFERPPFGGLNVNAPDVTERLKYLVDKGANLDCRYSDWTFLLYQACGSDKRGYQLALVALDYGEARYNDYYKKSDVAHDPYGGCYFRAIHFLAEVESEMSERPAEKQVHFRALVKWLEDHGESLAEAQADLKRWRKWKEEGREDLIEEEYQQRVAKENRQNERAGGKAE